MPLPRKFFPISYKSTTKYREGIFIQAESDSNQNSRVESRIPQGRMRAPEGLKGISHPITANASMYATSSTIQCRQASPLHPEAPTGSTTASLGTLLLQLLGHNLVGLEELGCTPVKADGLPLVQLAFAVVLGDAFLGAHCDHTVFTSRQ